MCDLSGCVMAVAEVFPSIGEGEHLHQRAVMHQAEVLSVAAAGRHQLPLRPGERQFATQQQLTPYTCEAPKPAGLRKAAKYAGSQIRRTQQLTGLALEAAETSPPTPWQGPACGRGTPCPGNKSRANGSSTRRGPRGVGAHVVHGVPLREEQHVIEDVKQLWRRLQQADDGREAQAVCQVGERRYHRLQCCTVQPCMHWARGRRRHPS